MAQHLLVGGALGVRPVGRRAVFGVVLRPVEEGVEDVRQGAIHHFRVLRAHGELRRISGLRWLDRPLVLRARLLDRWATCRGAAGSELPGARVQAEGLRRRVEGEALGLLHRGLALLVLRVATHAIRLALLHEATLLVLPLLLVLGRVGGVAATALRSLLCLPLLGGLLLLDHLERLLELHLEVAGASRHPRHTAQLLPLHLHPARVVVQLRNGGLKIQGVDAFHLGDHAALFPELPCEALPAGERREALQVTPLGHV
mmetsp:Transcript_37691/g.111894  ORF Transcript_37691/g.111894 Transcript_37691/m.111894 type:complete len:258 (+) Transcript_37691:957-1730(+)